MTVENISWSISTKECCWPRRGLNPRPPGLQLLIQIQILNGKQCRSRSVGFFRSQLIWIYTICKGRTYLGSAGQGLRPLTCISQVNSNMKMPFLNWSTVLRSKTHNIHRNFPNSLFGTFDLQNNILDPQKLWARVLSYAYIINLILILFIYNSVFLFCFCHRKNKKYQYLGNR